MEATFLKFTIIALNLTWLAGHAALEVALPHGLALETNDLTGQFHRKVASFRVPQIYLKLFITTLSGHHSWLEAAQFVFDANLDIYSAPARWQESGRVQADYIRTQDLSTSRGRFLFNLSPFKHDDGMYATTPVSPRF